jgi:hypothetical protein
MEHEMRKIILAGSIIAAMSALGAVGATAQTTGPASQDSMKTTSPMDSQNKMMMSKKKRMMMMKKKKMMMKKDGM